LSSGTFQWQRVVATGAVKFVSPILTAAHTILFGQQSNSSNAAGMYPPGILREFDANGNELRQATLPGGPLYLDQAALAGPFWVVASLDPNTNVTVINGFPLPGHTLAPSGWITVRGTQYRANRPR
jgi:hypothetical protein